METTEPIEQLDGLSKHVSTAEKTALFAIDTEDKANWLLGKLAAIDNEKARIKAQAEQRTRELDADRESLLFRFGAELEQWTRTEAERRRRKTVTLMQGTLAFRTVPAGLRFVLPDDYYKEIEVIEKAQELGCTHMEINRSEYIKEAKTLMETTGELLPGIERVEAKESFSIRFGSGKKGQGEEE